MSPDPPLPSGRKVFGADAPAFTGPDGIETLLGRRLGQRTRHQTPTGEHAGWALLTSEAAIDQMGAALLGDAQAGAQAELAVGNGGDWPPDALAQLAGGIHDQALHDLGACLHTASTIGPAISLRPMMEMNGAHNAGYHGYPALFAAAWRRLYGIIHSEAPSVSIIFCPQRNGDPWMPYWPGTAYVTRCGLTCYRCAPDDTQLAAMRVWAIAHHLFYDICESGLQQGEKVVGKSGGVFDKDGSTTGNSLIEAWQRATQADPYLRRFSVWSWADAEWDDRVDTSPASLAQYRSWIDSPEWGGPERS